VKTRFLGRIAALALVSGQSVEIARAQSFTPQQITALNNLQEEFTTCSAYYATQIACTSPARKQEDPILKIFNSMAVLIGSKIGMTKDRNGAALKARL
jgi:hypothetical protein